MKFTSALVILLPCAAALWPIPTNVILGNSTLWISRDVPIIHSGAVQVGPMPLHNELKRSYPGNPLSTSGNQIIETAVERTRRTLFEYSFVPWKFHPRNSGYEPSQASANYVRSITLQHAAADPADIIKPLDGAVDESYTLTMTMDGVVVITGNSSIGIAHGLTTFTQLFYKHSSGGIYTTSAPVSIYDTPKFVHRGLNMDVSRNYYGVEEIMRTIDALAYNKMNRLHLHITDAQSWPLVIPSIPELSAKGAYRPDLVYTPENVASIQLYGAQVGVEVYLEIDMPGHTSSIFYSHPELIASFNIQPDWNTYAAEPPSGTLKLNSSAVANFTTSLLQDLLPRVKPYTSYFHTGGDEVNANAYLNDDTVKSNDTKVLQPLMQAFVDRNHANVRAQGMTPIVWEEMLLQWNVSLGSDVLVQTWQSDEAVAQTVAKGHKALAGNYNYWYLDCGKGQWLNFNPGASSQMYYPYKDYCDPFKNWRLIYSYDPHSGVPEKDQHLVVGGEAHIWSEQTDPVNIDRVLWPRAAAAAEVLWSGAKDPMTGQNRSQVTAAPRLSDMRERLVARGVMAEPIQMPFCLMGQGQCSL